MKPVEVFSVVVRTIGLIVCLGASAVLFHAFLNLVMGGPVSVGGLIIVATPPLLVGLWMLRGASPLVAFAFPDLKQNEQRDRQVTAQRGEGV